MSKFKYHSSCTYYQPYTSYITNMLWIFKHTDRIYNLYSFQRNWELLCTYIYYVSGDKALVEDGSHETAQRTHPVGACDKNVLCVSW